MHGSVLRHASLFGVVLLLSACGGGNDDDGDITAANDDAVAGTVIEGGGAGDVDGPDSVGGTQDAPQNTTDNDPETWFESYQAADDVTSCSSEDLKRWVDHDMHDYYVYADRVLQLNLDDYADDGELVRALRIEPDEFSGVSDSQEFDARYEEGVVVGFGFVWIYDEAGRVRFQRVDENSPSGVAGLLRGDTLIAINGVAEADLTEVEYDSVYDMADAETARFTVQTGQAPTRDIDIAIAPYTLNTVPLVQARTYDDGRKVGYLVVSSFLEPTDAQLDASVGFLAEYGVTELILDLRYNGGGRSSVGNRLAARIGGSAVAGQEYSNLTRNDTYVAFNESEPFQEVGQSLQLSRLVVLGTGRTASASENLINGLRPFLDVTLIGQTTRGKPFSSQGLDYCGRTASLMNAIISNSVGVSVAGGIAPDCTVEDTVDFAISDDRDGLRAAALNYLAEGTCPIGVAAKAAPVDRPRLPDDEAFQPAALR